MQRRLHHGRLVRFQALGVVLILLCLMTLTLGACKTSSSTGSIQAIRLGVAEFQKSALTITAGQSVQFVDPLRGGGVHVLCIGENSQCAPKTGAPSQLNVVNGIQMVPGDPALVVTFPTPGVYVVVCTIHPGMVVTITVH